jgi:hypothetical protein
VDDPPGLHEEHQGPVPEAMRMQRTRRLRQADSDNTFSSRPLLSTHPGPVAEHSSGLVGKNNLPEARLRSRTRAGPSSVN